MGGQLHVDAHCMTLPTQFEELKADFRYNLGLLEDRDAELLKYDSDHAMLTATLVDRDRQLSEAQRSLADVTAGRSID